MAKARTVTEASRENWINQTFPEWGSWLNESIAQANVPVGNFRIWWLGNMGIWLQTHEQTNLLIDLWSGTGKQSHGDGQMKEGHQMMKMAGVKQMQPNLRRQPVVLDPYQIQELDAFLVSHLHSDHLDIHTAAAVLQTAKAATKFIGPQAVVDTWLQWGVPKQRTVVVRPGDEVQVGAVTIKALEAFDRTALLTVPAGTELRGQLPGEMDDLAVNFLLQTSAGNLYHGADSHMSNHFTKHGNDHQIDVELINYGDNPRGITDKMTSIDVLRSAEDLKTKVVIPLHYDIWTNFAADPQEILTLWRMKQESLQYQFHPFIWEVGGEYTYPQDQDRFKYHHDRGFADAFYGEADLPFPSFL